MSRPPYPGYPLYSAKPAPDRRWMWWTGGCLGAVIVVAAIPIIGVLAAFASWRAVDERALEREIAYVRERGDPLTVEEIEAFYPTSPAIEQATKHWQKAIEIVSAPEYGAGTDGVPFADRVRQFRTPLKGRDLAAGRVWVERYRQALSEAHAARRAAKVARFPIAFDQLRNGELPHVQGMRWLPGLLRLEMETRLVEGGPADVAAALDDALTSIALGESLANEPSLVSQTVRYTFLGLALDTTRRLVSAQVLDANQLMTLQRAWAQVDIVDGYRRGLAGERMLGFQSIQGESPYAYPDLKRSSGNPFYSRAADLAKALQVRRIREERLERDGLLGDLDRKGAPSDEAARLAQESIGNFYCPGTVMEIIATPRVETGAVRCQSFVVVAQVGIACERYRLANGDWPAKLADLVPMYLATPPFDPFDEAPLRYVVDDDGALIYSIGQNFADDGGDDDVVKGDLVFRLPNPREGEN